MSRRKAKTPQKAASHAIRSARNKARFALLKQQGVVHRDMPSIERQGALRK